jgi:hypothetical protein
MGGWVGRSLMGEGSLVGGWVDGRKDCSLFWLVG